MHRNSGKLLGSLFFVVALLVVFWWARRSLFEPTSTNSLPVQSEAAPFSEPLASFPDPVAVVSLQRPDGRPKVAGAFQVARDGSILISDYQSVFHWDADGRLLLELSNASTGQDVSACVAIHYDVDLKRYWLACDQGRRSLFFDEKGTFLGATSVLALDDGGQDEMHIRQLVPLYPRVFAVEVSPLRPWEEDLPAVMLYLEPRISPDGQVQVHRVGDRFSSLEAVQRAFKLNFKQHWVVGLPDADRFAVAGQASRDFRIFEVKRTESGEVLHRTDSFFVPALPNWVKPMPPPQGEVTREQRRQWLFSFSRLVGLFNVEGGVVAGYTQPVEGKLEEKLVLQKMDFEGHPVGPARSGDGLLLGALGDKVYLLKNDEADESLKVLLLAL